MQKKMKTQKKKKMNMMRMFVQWTRESDDEATMVGGMIQDAHDTHID